jgi:hypothetical protein
MSTQAGHARRARCPPPSIVGKIIEGVLYTMTKPRMPHHRSTRKIGGGGR